MDVEPRFGCRFGGGYRHTFKKDDFRVIILDRKNYLRQAISVYGLIQSPRGSAHQKKATSERPKVDIAAHDIIYYFEDRTLMEKAYKLIESEVNNTMRVSYEQLSENPAATVQDVFTFLGLKQIPVSTDSIVKTHRGAVADFVKDWGEGQG